MEKRDRLDLFWVLMGRMAAVMGVALLIPMTAAWIWSEPEYRLFPLPAGIALLLGSFMMWLGRDHMRQLTIREGALFMVLVWPLMGIIGLLPYYLSGLLPDPASAFFESISSIESCICSISTLVAEIVDSNGIKPFHFL